MILKGNPDPGPILKTDVLWQVFYRKPAKKQVLYKQDKNAYKYKEKT